MALYAARGAATIAMSKATEPPMRRLLAMALIAGLAAAPAFVIQPLFAAEGCTGDNCSKPADGSSGGHECERSKKDQTVS